MSDALTVHGWEVVHIRRDGGTTGHELTPFAVADAGRLTYPPAQASLDASWLEAPLNETARNVAAERRCLSEARPYVRTARGGRVVGSSLTDAGLILR